MKTITAEEFKRIIEGDPERGLAPNPGWATTLTEPMEITGISYLSHSPISHLSPLLHFTERAVFWGCKNLKTAAGTFHNGVDFRFSALEKIGELRILHPDTAGTAACFWQCSQLKIAEGTFPGYVDFANSGIEQIGELIIENPNQEGSAATFESCKNLKVARGTFPGFVDFSDSGVEEILDLKINTDAAVKTRLEKTPYIAKYPNASARKICGSLNLPELTKILKNTTESQPDTLKALEQTIAKERERLESMKLRRTAVEFEL